MKNYQDTKKFNYFNFIERLGVEVGGKLTYQVDLNRGSFQYVPDAKDGVKGKGSEEVDYRHRYDSEPDGDDVF